MRLVALAIGFLLVAAVAGEALARFGLGLGDPPLSITHPSIEYMFAPNQDVMRFGNRVVINEYGMRTEPLGTNDQRRRVLVIGDSVVNGGVLTDHANLATTILTDKTTLYLNVSAGSWGPENMLAYLHEYGRFGADRLVLVLSTHDAFDTPTFEPLGADHPTRKPLSALSEAIFRYAPRYLPFRSDKPAEPSAPRSQEPALAAARSIVDLGPTCVLLHPTQNELSSGEWGDAHDEIVRSIASAKVIDLMPYFSSSDYRDPIHLNEAGQVKLAKAIADCDADD